MEYYTSFRNEKNSKKEIGLYYSLCLTFYLLEDNSTSQDIDEMFIKIIRRGNIDNEYIKYENKKYHINEIGLNNLKIFTGVNDFR